MSENPDFNSASGPVITRLNLLSRRCRIELLFAVESGSRAWGFASANSDWDVRFVYLQPLDNYLCVHPRRDVIENSDLKELDLSKDDLDFAGWDLRKFFALALKSNPTVFEWLASPLVYQELLPFWTAVRQEVAKCFSPKASLYHYLSMARHNYREHLRDGTAAQVRLKKYLYITRPLLCCHWVEKHASPPPMAFELVQEAAENCDSHTRVPAVPFPVGDALDKLVERKRAGDELEEGPAVPVLNAWIDAELARLPAVAAGAPEAKEGPTALDELFQYATRVLWAGHQGV